MNAHEPPVSSDHKRLLAELVVTQEQNGGSVERTRGNYRGVAYIEDGLRPVIELETLDGKSCGEFRFDVSTWGTILAAAYMDCPAETDES